MLMNGLRARRVRQSVASLSAVPAHCAETGLRGGRAGGLLAEGNLLELDAIANFGN